MKNILFFLKRERQGLAIILLSFGASLFIGTLRGIIIKPISHVVVEKSSNQRVKNIDKFQQRNQVLKPFQLDTASKEIWMATGLSAKQADLLITQLKKGKEKGTTAIETISHFKYAPSNWFIDHKSLFIGEEQVQDELSSKPNTPLQKSTPIQQTQLDINTADTLQLIELPGIGAYTARKICAYRNALGGFYSLDQIREVRGVHEDQYLLFVKKLCIKTPYKRININSGSFEELAKHPYIRYKTAKMLIAYRNQHGPFNHTEWVHDLKNLPDSTLQKIKPYLR